MTGSRIILQMLWVALLSSGAAVTSGHPVVLITGADGGTGYFLAEAYAEQGWRVIATCRKPESATRLQSLAGRYANIEIEVLDVRVLRQIDALAGKYAGTAVDVLINNEELRPNSEPDETGAIDFDDFSSYIAVNVTAPLKITESFIEHIAASEHRKIITITSIDSSLANIGEPGDYFYRASKAAVNIIMVTMAPDLSQRDITIGLVAPLATDDDDTGALASQAHDIVSTIASFSTDTSVALIGSDGRQLAW